MHRPYGDDETVRLALPLTLPLALLLNPTPTPPLPPTPAQVLGACTFIPHASAGLCELQLLAVRWRGRGRG